MKIKTRLAAVTLASALFLTAGCSHNDQVDDIASNLSSETAEAASSNIESQTPETSVPSALPEPSPSPETEAEESVVSVEFISNYEETTGKQYATISGLDKTGATVWTYETGHYEAAQLDRVSEIGVNGTQYSFVEGGAVVTLRLSDGSLLWKNSEFAGSGTGVDFGDDGTIYLCGYLGPDFFAVDANGKTLCRIESFSPDYGWAYDVEYDGDQVLVAMEMTPSGEHEIISVSLPDYSYTLPSTAG